MLLIRQQPRTQILEFRKNPKQQLPRLQPPELQNFKPVSDTNFILPNLVSGEDKKSFVQSLPTCLDYLICGKNSQS
ncbi:15586_t:CDS:2 [Funneliformis mosseae]|uniref:15586_t:CDS:1 n=1 Tax=Funneliformis mosseae TaxID=27381 RepID=A0A9N8VBJ5_FUNMO|nr:15586_t:CDS:2 [Funneliformis mosseae]